MKKFRIEVIEKGTELLDDDLFSITGGAACTCQCAAATNCTCNGGSCLGQVVKK